MRDLNDYYFFVQAVEHKGFAAAGRALGLPKSTLSRRVIELESRLGARLIQRTTRSFVMTEAGQAFHRHATAMLAEADAAEHSVRASLAEPAGTVRFTCSIGMAQALADLLCRFLVLHPKVDLVQHATNRNVDLVEEGFDAGLRGHFRPLPDSSLVARRLARTPWHLYAGPGYLQRMGEPQSPAGLAAHPGLVLGPRDEESTWQLRDAAGQKAVVAFHPRLRSDDLETLKQAAAAGTGIVAVPPYLCRTEIAQGRLQRILPQWVARPDAEVSLLTPSRRGQLPSVRAFIDFLAAEFPLLAQA